MAQAALDPLLIDVTDPLLIDVPPAAEQLIAERTAERSYWMEVANVPSVRAEDREVQPEQEGERKKLYVQIRDWIYKRWDITDPTFALTVDGVCSGNEKVWSIWLDMAPIGKLRAGLAAIEGEDVRLGPGSPWRQPIAYKRTPEEMYAHIEEYA